MCEEAERAIAVPLAQADTIEIDALVRGQRAVDDLNTVVPETPDEVRLAVQQQCPALSNLDLSHPEAIAAPIDHLAVARQLGLHAIQEWVLR